MLMKRGISHKKFLTIVFLILVISSTIFIVGCKKNEEPKEFVDKALDVTSSAGDGCLPSSLQVVHYKTEKSLIDVGEDLPISISFGTYEEYWEYKEGTFDSVTAEFLMEHGKWDEKITNPEDLDIVVLKKIDDFTLDDYKGTFTSEENTINMIIPAEMFNYNRGYFIFRIDVIEVLANQKEFEYHSGAAAGLFYIIDSNKIKIYRDEFEFKKDVLR